MAKPSLWYPAKPFVVTQAWGIKNPSYLQFGFSAHNGVDFLPGKDNTLYSPTLLQIYEVGTNDGAGNYIRAFTPEKVTINGLECYMGVMFMHLEKALVKKGDVVDVGTPIAIPDNTGFSTGPHTHASFRRYHKKVWKDTYVLDVNIAENRTFDPFPYWNGKYAQDAKLLITLLTTLVNLLLGKKK